MVSETKKALFGLSTSAADQQSALKPQQVSVFRARFILDLLLSLVVLYFYTIFFVIPHFLITRLLQFTLSVSARFNASERYQSCKATFSTKANQIWASKVQPLATRITELRFYPLLKEKAIFVYETLILSIIELVVKVAKHIYNCGATMFNTRAKQVKEWVGWSVNNLSIVKQQIVEMRACKQTAHFIQSAVIARAVSLWNTQLLVLITFVKQAVMGKLNKRVTIVQAAEQQEATAAAATSVQFEEVKSNTTTSDQVEQAEAKQEEETAATAETTATSAPVESAPSKEETTTAATELVQQAPQQEENVEEQKQEQVEQYVEAAVATTVTAEPFLQPAPETTAEVATTKQQEASVHHEDAEEHEEHEHHQQKHQQHHASPRKGGKKHKNKNK